jgi:hypothetical protein
MTTPMRDKIKFNADNKFDLQLTDALINERRLTISFAPRRLKIELKSESGWERTGNICVGIGRTQAVRLDATGPTNGSGEAAAPLCYCFR